MSEFSDRPFVAGSLTGLRAFDVDGLGRLRGVTVADVMTPGENVGRCRKGDTTLAAQLRRMTYVMTYGTTPPTTSVEVEGAPEKPKDRAHQVGGVDCTCGYYAYYDTATNPYSGPDNVTALIQGYGVCSVGTRGFRAEKARLVAVVAPKPTAKTHGERWDAWSDWHYRHDGWNNLIVISGGFLALWAGVVATAALADGMVWLGIALACLVGLLTPLSIQAARGWAHGLWRRPPYPTRNGCPGSSDDGIPWDLVRRNYPDVPVYGSLRDALAEHPLTSPPAPSPEDADFWTQP